MSCKVPKLYKPQDPISHPHTDSVTKYINKDGTEVIVVNMDIMDKLMQSRTVLDSKCSSCEEAVSRKKMYFVVQCDDDDGTVQAGITYACGCTKK